MGYWDWKSILNIPFTPQRSQYDISTERKLTPYYLLEVYKLMTVQFDNWEIQLALCEAGKMDLRGDGIWAMTFRQPVNSSKRPDWLQAGVSRGAGEGLGVDGRTRLLVGCLLLLCCKGLEETVWFSFFLAESLHPNTGHFPFPRLMSSSPWVLSPWCHAWG